MTARILVIDDEEIVLRSCQRILADDTRAVDVVSDSLEGLRRIDEGAYDVVVLDIKMPRMDGLEVLRQLRGDERFKRLPVVVLTSSREETDLARSWDLGVNAYVVKPVDSEQFFHAVKTLGKFWAVLNETPNGE